MGKKQNKNQAFQSKMNKKNKKEKNKKFELKDAKEFVQKHSTTFWITLTIFFMLYLKLAEEGLSGGKMAEEDFYDVLGLSSSASIKDIKKQYNKLVGEYHPDKNPDCTYCEEKFSKISKAYEILSNEDSKNHYDQTSGVLEPIPSSTLSLTTQNFENIIEDSPKPWIIQIYSETDQNSQTFSGFWEEFAEKNSYLNFARINFNSQRSLCSKLPYAIEELPLVISWVPGEHSEMVDFWGDRSPNAKLNGFLRNSFGHHYRNITAVQFENLQNEQSSKPKIFLIGTSNIPIQFMYLSWYHKQDYDFYRTNAGLKNKIQNMLKNNQAQIVYQPSKDYNLSKRIFTGTIPHKQLLQVQKYANFIKIPDIAFKIYVNNNKIKIQKSILKRHLPLVCFIAIQNNDSFKEVEVLFKNKIQKFEEEIFQLFSSNKDNFNTHIQRFQFASINLGKNSQFKKYFIDKMSIKNPKYFVYVDGTDQVQAYNNLDEFDEVFEDSLEGIFEDFYRVKDLVPKDQDISMLLRNENLTIFKAVLSVFTFRNLLTMFLIFCFVFLLANKFFKYTQNLSLLIAAVMINSMLCYQLINKIMKVQRGQLILLQFFMYFQFDKKQFYEFLNLSLTFITIQIFKILPILISTMLISLNGDDLSIQVFGISNIIINLVFYYPVKSIIEVLEKQIDICFNKFKKNLVSIYFWNSICLMIMIICLTAILFLNSDYILLKLKIQDQLVDRLFQYLNWCQSFLFLQGFNFVIQNFYNNVSRESFQKQISIIYNLIIIPLTYYFIQYQNHQEYGYIYAKIYQEIVSLIYSLYLIKFRFYEEYLSFPKMQDLINNMLSFIKDWLFQFFKCSIIFLSFDFSVYLASQFNNKNKFSAWIIFISIYSIYQMIGKGFGMSLKFIIKNCIKNYYYSQIKKVFIPLFVYIFICSLLTQLLIYFQKSDISQFFTINKIIQDYIVQCLMFSLFNIYIEYLDQGLMIILKEIKEDQIMIYFNLIFNPLYTLIFFFIFCFQFQMDLKGLILTITSRKLISVIFKIILLYKIDDQMIFDKSKSFQTKQFIQMSIKTGLIDESSIISSNSDESFQEQKKNFSQQLISLNFKLNIQWF